MDRNMEKRDRAIKYLTTVNLVDKRFCSKMNAVKEEEECLIGVSITSGVNEGNKFIEFWTRHSRIIYPFGFFDGDDDWNEIVKRINTSIAPDIVDIIALVTNIQKDLPVDDPRFKNHIITLRNIKIGLQSTPYILFSATKQIKNMTEEELLNECVILHSNYPNLGFTPTQMQLMLTFKETPKGTASLIDEFSTGIQ